MDLFRITSFSPEPSMFANFLLAVIPLIIVCHLNKVKIFCSTTWDAFSDDYIDSYVIDFQ